MKYLGFSITTIMILGAILAAGPIWAFIDTPSLIMVIGMTTGLSLFKYKKEGLTFWKIENQERKSEIAAWIGKTCLHVGLFSALVGFIQIGSFMNDMSAFGPAFAVAVMPIFYSYLIYFFLTSPHVSGQVRSDKATAHQEFNKAA
jgi:flagellar motor component MotA